uniref:Protein with SprT-like domain at the N terminus n=1 Tax=Loa loa TaxID=7209 RepID=A0A1I7V5I9_LOALO
MSKKIFELKDLQHIHAFQDIPQKKKRYNFPAATSSSSSNTSSQSNSLVDPIWEIIDPTPDLHALFQQYDDTFFNGRLVACEVKWSSRMTACAGLCSFERKGGFCSIRLSKPLLQYRPRKDLVETLLHEMIHAFLFLSDGVMDRDGHGPMFQFHMHRINMTAGTNITIYHNFHNEVQYHQKHWWRCTGLCRMRPPFYGWVKRSMNRAPGANDFWWKEHQMTCGGKFIKVKEPEAYGTKKKVSEVSNGKSQSQTWQTPLNQYFTGKGHVLGHLSSSSEDILAVKEKTTTVATSRNDFGLSVKEKIPKSRPAVDDSTGPVNNDIIICVPCPVCNVCVPENIINSHLDSCLTQNS